MSHISHVSQILPFLLLPCHIIALLFLYCFSFSTFHCDWIKIKKGSCIYIYVQGLIYTIVLFVWSCLMSSACLRQWVAGTACQMPKISPHISFFICQFTAVKLLNIWQKPILAGFIVL